MKTTFPNWIAIGALFLVGCATVRAPQPSPSNVVEVRASNDGSSCSSAPVRRVIEYANAERRVRGRPLLECSDKLAQVAESHVSDMCRRHYVGHVDPDGVGPRQRVEARGIDYTAIGENVAHGQPDAFNVHEGWMTSPGHRKNILHPDFRRIGVAVDACDGRPYWVQMFASG